MRNHIERLILSLFVMAMVGCEGMPEEPLEAAEQALMAADSVEAPVYAAEAYQEARQALAAARTEIAAQNERFAVSRDYTRAVELLRRATDAAERAAQEAPERKTVLQTETETLLLETGDEGRQAQVLLKRMRIRDREERRQWEGKLAEANQLVMEASTAQASGDVAVAHEKITRALTIVQSVARALEEKMK